MREGNQVLEAPGRSEALVYRDVEELPDQVSPANPGFSFSVLRNVCDDADALRPWKHEAPFYRVELVAIECGPGSRQRSHKREIKRTILRKLCANCFVHYETSFYLRRHAVVREGIPAPTDSIGE